MSRRKARELVLQILFQEDLSRRPSAEVEALFWQSRPRGNDREYAEELFRLAMENEETIEELIRQFTEHWRLERLAAVDRNILRMAIAHFNSKYRTQDKGYKLKTRKKFLINLSSLPQVKTVKPQVQVAWA